LKKSAEPLSNVSPSAPGRVPTVERGQYSVTQLLKLYGRLGIPHFQRGLVWGDGAKALLLESLYFATPCGSVVLWKPSDAAAYGKSLPGANPLSDYLVIDGQQRIRSLHEVFDSVDETPSTSLEDQASADVEQVQDGDPASAALPEIPKIWCLNLGRLPQLSFKGGQSFDLFRHTQDPRLSIRDDKKRPLQGAPLDNRNALLPLKWFLVRSDSEINALLDQYRSQSEYQDQPQYVALVKAAQAVLDHPDVNSGLRMMCAEPLFNVSMLQPSTDFEEAVRVYVRINSAGMRVEAEETAYANLVAVKPEAANEALTEFFKISHEGDPKVIEQASRDDLLERQKESRFGFKLFMRVLAIELAYHRHVTIGSTTFSFDSFRGDTLASDDVAGKLEEILVLTNTVLAAARTILRKDLFCDDFRFLPDTSRLWPLFHVLIRYPELIQTDRPNLASITLRLLLGDVSKPYLLRLCEDVCKSRSAPEVIALFNLKALSLSEPMLRVRLAKSSSLMDRYTQMLYWALRRAGAMDFDYRKQQLGPDKIEWLLERHGEHAPISVGLKPQKQHIVPYATLERIYGLSGPRRGSELVHNIGNITYISSDLNSFQRGLGSEPLKLRSESEGNLKHHLLEDKGTLLDHFEAAAFKESKTDYELFTAARREQIVKALWGWVASSPLEPSPESKHLRAVAPLINRGRFDKIREYEYPDSIENALLGLANDHKMRQRPENPDQWRVMQQGRLLARLTLSRTGATELKLQDKNVRSDSSSQFTSLVLEGRKCDLDWSNGDLERALLWLDNWLHSHQVD
jgi:hypothetical protein